MAYEVEYTDEFEEWWDDLDAEEQESVRAGVEQLTQFGPFLRFPHCSKIQGSRHRHMRELRIQHHGQPYRVILRVRPETSRHPADRWRQDRG